MRSCTECPSEVIGRSDRKQCSPECKREAKRRYDRERYPSIRSTTIERARAWQRDNAERKSKYDSIYRELTRDHRLQIKREWDIEFRRAHPEAGRLRQSKRRATKMASGAFRVTRHDLARLLVQYRNHCAYCRGTFSDDNPLEWDHVVPIARGGRHSIGNLVPSCRACNRSKSKRFVAQWRRDLSSLTIL